MIMDMKNYSRTLAVAFPFYKKTFPWKECLLENNLSFSRFL